MKTHRSMIQENMVVTMAVLRAVWKPDDMDISCPSIGVYMYLVAIDVDNACFRKCWTES